MSQKIVFFSQVFLIFFREKSFFLTSYISLRILSKCCRILHWSTWHQEIISSCKRYFRLSRRIFLFFHTVSHRTNKMSVTSDAWITKSQRTKWRPLDQSIQVNAKCVEDRGRARVISGFNSNFRERNARIFLLFRRLWIIKKFSGKVRVKMFGYILKDFWKIMKNFQIWWIKRRNWTT